MVKQAVLSKLPEMRRQLKKLQHLVDQIAGSNGIEEPADAAADGQTQRG
jgi:hypothetical protein